MKIADLLQASVAEHAETMRRQAQAVASVIEAQIADIETQKADDLEMVANAKARRLERFDAFVRLHSDYFDAENTAEQIVVEGRLAGFDKQIQSLRNMAERVLAGEPSLPNNVPSTAGFLANVGALIDPPTVMAGSDFPAPANDLEVSPINGKVIENGTSEESAGREDDPAQTVGTQTSDPRRVSE